ncbi:MAG TPA: hypothetical protein VK939_09925 [Longimicrobiales bacterium]|nr:hypothetical protein [Longimicrobiales bacterium]
MTSATMTNESTRTGAVLHAGVGLPGRVTITWTVAGGILAGGFLVAAMTLGGKLSGNALLLTSGALYLMGAFLGFAHGTVLGWFARGEMTARQFLGRLGLAAAYTIPVLALGFIVAGWIAMTVVAMYLGKPVALGGVVMGWVVGAALVLSAAGYGVAAAKQAFARWGAHAPLGTALTAATFASLLILFLAERPTIWGLQFRVTEVGAVLLAWIVAVWVAGPVITLSLRLLERLPEHAALLRGDARSPVFGILIGLAVGVVLSLVALPFYHPPIALANVAGEAGIFGATVIAVSQALVTEVLLRVFLVTAVAFLVLRWYELRRQEAAVVGVLAATLVQVMLYLPGVLALGLPSSIATVGYVLAAVVLPGLAFGTLYWKRGLSAALAGHATALIALALLV